MRFFLFFSFFLLSLFSSAQIWKRKSPDVIGVMNGPNAWADSVFKTLTVEQRLGQLFMVAAYSNSKETTEARIDSLIKIYNIGGLIFMQGTPEKQGAQTNYYQSIAPTPLMIAMDAEWGLGMRLTGIKDLPRSMTLGATGDERWAYELGKTMGRQCKLMGVHINFAPVMDINNNPDNPVINFRSFGEDKENVTRKALAVARGLQEERVMACSKHFPGHGDTNTDSHEDLPTISASLSRMDSLELFPFREAVKKGIGATMVAHLNVPALGDSARIPTTLSAKAIQELLQDDLKFRVLTFTDALNMKGISKYYDPGELEVRALEAGNDVLLFAQDVPLAIEEIKKALLSGRLDEKEIDRKVKKILRSKYWMGLSSFTPIDTTRLTERLQPEENWELSRTIYEEAITLVKNDSMFLPLVPSETEEVTCIVVGNNKNQEIISENIRLSGRSTLIHVDWKADSSTLLHLFDSVATPKKLQFFLQIPTVYPKKKFGMPDSFLGWMDSVAQRIPSGVMILGNAYACRYFDSVYRSVSVVYENTPMAQLTAVQAVFGAIPFKGALPVTAGNYSHCSGICMAPLTLPAVGKPIAWTKEYQWLSQKIDSIVQIGLSQNAYPGCQVIVIHRDRIVHRKNYGYLDYSKSQPVQSQTIYDLASVTKVASTTNLLMMAREDGKFKPTDTLGKLEPNWQFTNKASISMAEWMTHQAGLPAFIPFYQKWDLRNPDRPLVSDTPHPDFRLEIAKNLWGNNDLPALVFDSVLKAPLQGRGMYKYSDLGFGFGQYLLELWYRKPINLQFEEKIAAPLGLNTATFLPLKKFPLNQIAPTEDDKTFRKQVVRGYVHDQTAAMKGGVAGHAGLFSNATDLSKIGYLWMRDGGYGDENLLSDRVISSFTQPYFMSNRRGLCFDKPAVGQSGSPCSKSTPATAFGHTGFTGTCIWVDPENEWVFVFLSNRVHPFAEVNKLASLNIRTLIQEELYQFKTEDGGEKMGKLPKEGLD
jgi:beta-glucosidase-like glycosyl hydrolase/CubicO group peptidase (beta-lactamase class C family)